MPLQALQVFEKKIEKRIKLFEQKLEQNIEKGLRKFEQKKNVILLDDDVRFIRSWIEKPLSMGAVTPSSRILARTMAGFVQPEIPGPIIELGPGTGPVTEALVSRGIDPSRLVLVEFNPAFCQLLRDRYPTATVLQGDAYRLKKLLESELDHPAAAVVSGLPLVTKPMRTRLRLLREALDLLRPGAPYVQFTYSVVPPIPRFAGVQVEASERIWLNLPPARVWTYRNPARISG